MAVISGIGGSITGATYVATVRNWSVTIGSEAIETTTMSPASRYRTRIGGLKTVSGSYSCYLDSATLASIDDDLGSAVTAVFTLSGSATIEVSIIVTDVSVTANTDNAVEVEFSFEGSGAPVLTNGS
jgi:predicted secreted protein